MIIFILFPQCLFFFLLYGPFLKSLLNLLQYRFCFMFWFFGPKACEILAPQPGTEPAPPPWKGNLNHRAARESLSLSFRLGKMKG